MVKSGSSIQNSAGKSPLEDRRRGGFSPWVGWMALIVLLAAAPLLSLLWQASGNSGDVWPHLVYNVLPHSSLVTASLLLGVGAGTLVVGSVTAWLVSQYRFPLRDFLQWALILPLAVPTYVVAYTWGEFADYTGPIQTGVRWLFGYETSRDYWFPDIRSTGGAIFLLSVVLFPYVYLPARLAFRQQAASLIDVARVLGAGPTRLFLKIALPAARPAIAVGVILALMETLNDIGAVEFLGVRTLTFSVFDTWLNRSSLAGAAQLSIALLVIVAGLLHLERRLRSKRAFHTSRQSNVQSDLVELTGMKALTASVLCLAPILLGFGVPLFQMIRFTLAIPEQVHNSALISAAFNSVEVALVTSICCVVIGFLLVYAVRRDKRPMFKFAMRFAGLGYSVPGTILAIGVLTLMTGLDNQISAIWQALFGEKTGLLISGSIAIVIFACSVRFLTIAMGNIEAGYERLSPNLTDAARTLGRNEVRALREVELPLMTKALGVAGLLVFVETMKELSATLMLRPFNFDTLATHVYGNASRALFEEASFASLLIVLFGLIPVYMLTRVIISERNL